MAASPDHVFPSTHWSFVTMAGQADTASQFRALHHFLERYQTPLLAHLRGRHRLDVHDAADVLQGFITDKVIEKRLLTHATQGRGRFRSFLLTTLDNFVIDGQRRKQTQRRLESAAELTPRFPGPVPTFEIAWARQVLSETVDRMERECARTNRADVWAIFEGRVLRECLHQQPPVPYEDLIADLRLPGHSQATNLLVTGKRMFARLLRDVVAEYGSDQADIESELQDLRAILAHSSSTALQIY